MRKAKIQHSIEISEDIVESPFHGRIRVVRFKCLWCFDGGGYTADTRETFDTSDAICQACYREQVKVRGVTRNHDKSFPDGDERLY